MAVIGELVGRAATPTTQSLDDIRVRSPRAELFRRVRRHHGATIGAVLLVLLVAMSVFAAWIMPYDPFKPVPADTLQPPSVAHWMGTDNLGRDVLSRLILGAQISLRVGFISVGIALFFGVPFGLLAGFYGGRVDNVVMRFVDVLLAFPGILLAMAVVSILGTGTDNVMIAIGIGATPTYIRVVRASVLAAKELTYVEAARATGVRDARLMFLHILPNIMGPLIVVATLGIAGAILAASGLSYLGLGAKPPEPEWGAMLSGARSFIRSAWWLSTFPGLAIMITVLAINMLGDGLRDALDPHLRN